MKNWLKIMPVVAGALLATGCGNIVNVQTAQTDEDKSRFAGAPSFKDALNWPNPVVSRSVVDGVLDDNVLNLDVVDTDSAKRALHLARKKVDSHDGYDARVLLRKVAGYKDGRRNIYVPGLFEEDLRNVLDGKPLQRWNGGKQRGKLEEEALGFLDFMSSVYETWFKSEPVKNEAETAFNNLIRAMSARESYNLCAGKTNSIPETIRERYLRVGPDLEKFLAYRLREENKSNEFYQPDVLAMPSVQPTIPVGEKSVKNVANSPALEIPPSIKMRDYMDRETEKWMRRYRMREAVKSVENGYQGNREGLFIVGDLTGKRTEIPESYTRNSRESVLKVARRN